MLANTYRALRRVLTPHDPWRGRRSFSQCGEDLIIDYVFDLRGIRQPSYIDVGAHDPMFLNNTAIFYRRACRGINIEANPSLVPKFSLYRPLDCNLNLGVGAVQGVMSFFVMEDPTLSTFSETERDHLCKLGHRLERVLAVTVDTLPNIVRQFGGGKFPDLLSIDIEGQDSEVLRSLDFSIGRPKVVCVEAAEYSPRGDGRRRTELIELLEAEGYFEYANTNLNAIMVCKEFWG